MEPRMTSDGKFICNADNKTFNTSADYDRHCSETHLKDPGKNWLLKNKIETKTCISIFLVFVLNEKTQ
jgi:hypothetical protein